MKDILKQISSAIKKAFGYGMMLCLFAGGLTFFAYLVALVIGGETAAAICEFVYKRFIPILVYCTTTWVMLGLAAMYMNGEMALTSKKKK